MRLPPVVEVQVPGTTANLGPGFDTLGVALSLYNRVRVTRTKVSEPVITSPIASDARPGATSIVSDAARLFFRKTRQRSFGFEIHLSGDVPIARGLGSSVTVRLGTLAALDALSGTHLTRDAFLQLVTELEGHPDNAAPAIYGGFTASAMVGGEARCVRFSVKRAWEFVTLIPPFEVSTSEARRLLPDHFTKADTVHNLTRVSLITAAFAAGDADILRGAFEDRIHQPYREPLIPALNKVIRAGERAGAVGGWLSGSGSTIVCLTVQKAAAVERAMRAALPASDVRRLSADRGGYRVRVPAGVTAAA